MARITAWRIILGLTASGLLGACVETSDATDTETAVAAPSSSERLRPGTEVEAPEVFQASESALWDGRPSLGGIWIASPDAVDPERVVMFNPATGKTVKGALFRRERDNPGPRLQLSSDAADALGVLAGMPTEIVVTALRKQEAVEEPAAVEPLDAAPAEAVAETAAAPGADAEAAAVAAAALAAVDAEAGASAEAAPAGADATVVDPAAEGAVVEEPPKKKTWKEKRAEAKAAREAKKAAAAAAKAAAAGSVVVAEGAEVAAAPTAETAGVEAIESAPLDARKPEVAAGEAEAPKPAAAETVEEAAPATPEPAASVGGGAQRPIQIASFSKEENAKRAVDALAKIDISAQPQKSEKDGKSVWGVVATGDEAMLKKIKDAGFADAYFLK